MTSEGKKLSGLSMPYIKVFDELNNAYKEEVPPKARHKRIVILAALSLG